MTIKDKYNKSDYLMMNKLFDGDYQFIINEKPNKAVILLGKKQIRELKKYLNENSKK